MSLQLERSWRERIGGEFNLPYMLELKQFLQREKSAEKVIFPKGKEYFAALNLTPFDDVRVVILGQDPYHGPNQAHGLCFSVRPGVKAPPSLVNIYKELHFDLGLPIPQHGFLESWAKQGVLMLNSVLTVEARKPASHKDRGWEKFTDSIIQTLNDEKQNLVFILWGAYAQKKGELVDRSRHHVIESVHPSPFSANRGFFGSRPFSRTNLYLEQHGYLPIDWSLPKEVAIVN